MNPLTDTPKRSATAVESLEEQGLRQKPKLDLWDDDAHRTLDQEITDTYGEYKKLPPANARWTAVAVLDKIKEQVKEKLSGDPSPLLDNDILKEMTAKAWEKGSFKEIRNTGKCFWSFSAHYTLFDGTHVSEIWGLEASSSHPELKNTASGSSQQAATLQAWGSEFKGEADKLLFDILKNYLAWSHKLLDVAGAPYANVVPIVNSSGTGKSRVVDELGKKYCFVIHLCLRSDDADGYPPPDCGARDWLLKGRSTEQDLNIAVAAFLRALFEIARGRIVTISSQRQPDDPRAVHAIFAQLMNKVETFKSPSLYRKKFYAEVVELATKFENQSNELVRTGDALPDLEDDPDIQEAASSLLRACEERIVVLSFDEAHRLGAKPIIPSPSSPSIPSDTLLSSDVPLGGSTSREPPATPIGVSKSSSSETSTGAPAQASRQGVTMFSQIRKGLRSVLLRNIVGLYLSTSGKYRLIVPEPQHDRSSRVANKERVMLPPITEFGFNQLALKLDNPPTLEQVTTEEYISHQGRPIFGTRWDNGDVSVQKSFLDFAISKLAPRSPTSTTNVLACLAVRFPIEFRPRNERQEDLERSLVENHMRYCAAADPRLRMVTIAPSEPPLVEAAFVYLHFICELDFLQVLAKNVDTWGIHQGDRGEFVMSLIWMAARDAAVLKPFPRRRKGDWGPWKPQLHVVSIVAFMKELLPAHLHQQLNRMVPTIGEGEKFEQAFTGVRLWCNHIIQVQDYTVINTKFLCALLSNGIGVLCALNQAGIDLLWIGLKGDVICEENLMLILGQAKNDKSYGKKPDKTVLAHMDPIGLGICPDVERVTPIIRIVFALASEQHGVTLVQPPQRRSSRGKPPNLTSYDFWFAGVGPSTFGCVMAADAGYYQDLLASSRPVYNPPLPVPSNLMDLDEYKDLKTETMKIGEARVEMRRAANCMTMALQPHFPGTWHNFLFNEKKKGNENENENADEKKKRKQDKKKKKKQDKKSAKKEAQTIAPEEEGENHEQSDENDDGDVEMGDVEP